MLKGTTMDEEREAFEKHFGVGPGTTGTYQSSSIQGMWIAWLARSALVNLSPDALSEEQLDAAEKTYATHAVPAWTSNRHRPALARAVIAAMRTIPEQSTTAPVGHEGGTAR